MMPLRDHVGIWGFVWRLYVMPKDEDDLKNGDDLKNEDIIKNEDNLKNKDDLKKKWP